MQLKKIMIDLEKKIVSELCTVPIKVRHGIGRRTIANHLEVNFEDLNHRVYLFSNNPQEIAKEAPELANAYTEKRIPGDFHAKYVIYFYRLTPK